METPLASIYPVSIEHPILLQEWINSQTVDDEMLWKGAWGHQMAFIRDTLQSYLAIGLDYEDSKIAQVISTHRSKSIVLPVVQMHRPDLSLRITVRNNFYNWKLSVESDSLVNEPHFAALFHTTPPIEPSYTGNHLASCYFEGFPPERIFGYYSLDQRQFSAEIGGDYQLMTVIWLLLRERGAVKDIEVEYPRKSSEGARRQSRRRAKRDAERRTDAR